MSESAVFVTAIARLQSITIRFHQRAGFCLTSKMSHDRGWRAACGMTIWILRFHFETLSVARGVTAMVVGSGALLGSFFIICLSRSATESFFPEGAQALARNA